MDCERVDFQAREVYVRGGSVLEGEHHLEQWRTPQLTFGLDLLHQLFERQILMGESPER